MFGRTVHVTVRDAEDGKEAVRRRLAAARIEVASISAVEPTLEDVFTALVRAEGGAVVG
jgi:ribosomal protein S11